MEQFMFGSGKGICISGNKEDDLLPIARDVIGEKQLDVLCRQKKIEGEHSRMPFAPYFVVAMEWLISKVRDILYDGTIFYHATKNALSQNFLLVVFRSRGYLSVVDNGVVHFQSVPRLKAQLYKCPIKTGVVHFQSVPRLK